MAIREIELNSEVYKVNYMGHWIQEDNNMNKRNIYDELRRIFGADPMNFVESVRHEMDYTWGEHKLVLTLHVPGNCERYLKSSPLYHREAQVDFFSECTSHTDVPEKPKKENATEFIKPERIVYSGPKTILIWPDGTKTIVSLMEGDKPDEYAAFCSAIVKKMFGSTHKAKKFLDGIKTYKASNPRKREKVAEEDSKQ